MPQRSGQPRFQPPLKGAVHRRERRRGKTFPAVQGLPELEMLLAVHRLLSLDLERLRVTDMTEKLY